MRKTVVAVTLAAFGMAPAFGIACEYGDKAMGPVDIGLAPEPAATKVPTAPALVKAPVTAKTAKTATRTETPAPQQKESEQKVAASLDSPVR